MGGSRSLAVRRLLARMNDVTIALDYAPGVDAVHRFVRQRSGAAGVAANPAHAVRGPKHVVKTGKTTVLCYTNGMESDGESKALVPAHQRPLTSVAWPQIA